MLFTLKDRRRPAVAATRLTVADRYRDRRCYGSSRFQRTGKLCVSLGWLLLALLGLQP